MQPRLNAKAMENEIVAIKMTRAILLLTLFFFSFRVGTMSPLLYNPMAKVLPSSSTSHATNGPDKRRKPFSPNWRSLAIPCPRSLGSKASRISQVKAHASSNSPMAKEAWPF